MSRLRRPGCKRRICRLRVPRLKFGNGNPGQFEERSCSLPLGSVLHRWRPIPVKEGFPLPEVTDQSKVCPGHGGDHGGVVYQPKYGNGIRNKIKRAHKVDDSGDGHENRAGWRAKPARELGTKETKKYLQAFPRSKKKFVASLCLRVAFSTSQSSSSLCPTYDSAFNFACSNVRGAFFFMDGPFKIVAPIENSTPVPTLSSFQGMEQLSVGRLGRRDERFPRAQD